MSRRPRAFHGSDEAFAADLLDPREVDAAVAGSEIAYLTAGLPSNTALWAERFPVMMQNTIDACTRHGVRLVFFDNTYMYPKTSAPQTEETRFEPVGGRSTVRARVATMLLEAMSEERVEAVIC